MELARCRPELNLIKRLIILILLGIVTFFITNSKDSKTFAIENKNKIFAKLVCEENLREHLFEIASGEYEGRGAGYEGERKIARYIAKHFRQYGLVSDSKLLTCFLLRITLQKVYDVGDFKAE